MLARAPASALGLTLTLGLAPALAACTGHADDAPDRRWRAVSLPLPPGPSGRIAVREATRCGDSWYVVGGVFLDHPTQDQDSRPAAWRSTDGRAWTPLAIDARTFWGQRAILASVACAHGTVAVVGARSGGAHGNPRVTTFYEDAAGLHDVDAPYTQYGGEQATNVGPIAGGAGGWLITGNRVSGPAVWTSPTGHAFTIHEGAPGLANDATVTALAQDAAWDGRQWVVVGGGNGNAPGDSLDRQPEAWTSPDGATWSRETVPGSLQFDDVERAVATPDGVLALGLRGSSFGSWHRHATWTEGETFGHLPSDASKSPFVASLSMRVTSGADDFWATTSDGARYALWRSADGDSWTKVATPTRAPDTGGEHILSVAADAAGVLLLSDDGARGRIWVTDGTG
ncbi:hypothetical protein GCM10009798_05900 [Nocardioides panacihumi]|uniref:Galactose oxidase n=1 Tax=Nocardioides panacihumi TaxID=400774 RepID=A0ABN2QFL1_9ACTN